MLLHPDSQRLIPDLHETAAWLAALDIDFRSWLINHEPEAALEADFATLAQANLPALVDGMLRLATEEQRPSYDRQSANNLSLKGLALSLLGPSLMGAEAFFRQISPSFLETACLELRYHVYEDSFLDQLDAKDWHPSFLQQLASTRLTHPDWPFYCRLRLAELLIRNKVEGVIEGLIDWLTTEPDLSNRSMMANTLFLNAVTQTWPHLQKLLANEADLAQEVILGVADNAWRTTSVYSKLDVEQLGWLYERIRHLFPPSEDPPTPNGVFTPYPRLEVVQFRDGIIGWLVGLATQAAINELDRICQAYPDTPWLIRAKADACKNLWRQERTRLSFAESIRLSAHRLRELPQPVWHEAYSLRGTGSTFERRMRIEGIYERWVPVPDARGDKQVYEFLNEVKDVVMGSVKAVEQEVLDANPDEVSMGSS